MVLADLVDIFIYLIVCTKLFCYFSVIRTTVTVSYEPYVQPIRLKIVSIGHSSTYAPAP